MPGLDAPVIGLVGGVGGAGTSTFAAVLAATASATLVDLDAACGGIDVLLGVEDAPGSRWSGVRLDGGRLDPRSLADGLPRWGAARVLAADEAPSPEAVSVVVATARELGPVVVDLGRAASPAAQAAVDRCDLILVVARADVAALVAARATAQSLGATGLGLVLCAGALRAHAAAELAGIRFVAALPRMSRRGDHPIDPDRLPRRLERAASAVIDGCRS
ncbi:MAG TPA: hypothetical protein VJ831_15175 [Jatrophihabitantaceae bacterium]|nr:hypothetical protein [Jatrophihabitantaceae bacterium]